MSSLGLPFLLAEASTNAGRVDLLFFVLIGVTIFFSLLICVAILFFAVKYRRGSKVDRSNPPSENLPIEIAWTAIPTAIALGLYVWGTWVFFVNNRPPANAMEITVVGKQWMWKIQHPEGRWEMDELHVPVGRPVKLTMTSEDVIHDFFIPEFRVKQDVVPGRYAQLWFQATKVGTYHLFCAQYCGTNHSGMVGTVTVMDPSDYERWLRTGTYQGSMAAAGERLFMQHGCSGCHGENSSVNAPLLNGIYGKPVAVQIPPAGMPLSQLPSVNATTMIADDRYLHDCILQPQKVIPAGFKPIMPSFQGQLQDEEILELIAYIKSLSTSNGASNGGSRGDFTGPLTPGDIQARTGFVPKNMKQIISASKNNHPNSGPNQPGSVAGAGTSAPAPPTSATGQTGLTRPSVRPATGSNGVRGNLPPASAPAVPTGVPGHPAGPVGSPGANPDTRSKL